MEYPLVDSVDLYFFIDGVFGLLFVFFDGFLFLEELLFEEFDSVLHGFLLFALPLHLVLFVHH